jgi:hypothetical protein
MMLITASRPIAAIRVGPMAATEWSMAFSRNPCRSEKSPGIRTVRICRLPSGIRRKRYAIPRVRTNAERGVSPSIAMLVPARKRSSRKHSVSSRRTSWSDSGANRESLATSGFLARPLSSAMPHLDQIVCGYRLCSTKAAPRPCLDGQPAAHAVHLLSSRNPRLHKGCLAEIPRLYH